ncbi:MAG: phosphoribosylanthranilate isomerase [Lachnospiraceae bacterium]|nr:phosphoribosylanthranilate isomerase [Lachnospiraceae bacterium]
MAKIKICGLSRKEDISYVNEAKPDYCGFIINFPKSRRNVTPDQVRALVRELNQDICPIGVFVNQPMEEILSLAVDGTLGAVQLHGSETQEYVRELKKRLSEIQEQHSEGITEKQIERCNERRLPVIQAFQIAETEDVRRAAASEADFILLDKGTGSGQTFDWNLVQEIGRPFFLAGGLGPENLAEAIVRLKPYAVDMSSKVETDGIKDGKKIAEAVRIVRAVPNGSVF